MPGEFPRIKTFKFDYRDAYEVPSHLVGKLHRIAYEIYGSIAYYKPLAAANNIRVNTGSRVGIRPTMEALRKELSDDGYSSEEINKIVSEKMQVKRISEYDWNTYGDVSYGYVSEVTAGKVLLVPTPESAKLYLAQYEYLEQKAIGDL